MTTSWILRSIDPFTRGPPIPRTSVFRLLRRITSAYTTNSHVELLIFCPMFANSPRVAILIPCSFFTPLMRAVLNVSRLARIFFYFLYRLVDFLPAVNAVENIDIFITKTRKKLPCKCIYLSDRSNTFHRGLFLFISLLLFTSASHDFIYATAFRYSSRERAMKNRADVTFRSVSVEYAYNFVYLSGRHPRSGAYVRLHYRI